MSSQKRSRANYELDPPPSHAPFAIYGTPLPAFDPDVRDDGSYVPIWKQEVTDERGRKRLHGAFTGGWSAGYFNTVGSKEGWTPATFVSSRNKRAQKSSQQRAEDFMDDEDLAEQAESQNLEMQGSFAGLGDSSKQTTSTAIFSDIFRATGDTMGVRLLQRMGWRQGQGIGSKVQRMAQGDKVGEVHLFAPDNARIVTFARKNDRKGIGFAGETGLTTTASNDHEDDADDTIDARILSSGRSKLLTRTKKAPKSSFGVGVLNDTGSDDEDPYSIGPQIKYNRIIGGEKKKRGGIHASTTKAMQSPLTKLTHRASETTRAMRKCHDGKLPISGFILSTNINLPHDNAYPPPDVPPEWRSGRKTSATAKRETAYTSTADAAKASTLDATSRAQILGEQQLPGKSVFDFLKPAARDKLAAASGRADLPQARGEGTPAEFVQPVQERKSMWDVIPRLEKTTAVAALQRGSSGWMPYAEDLDKRDRYRAFLSIHAGLNSSTPQHPKGLSTDEWIREMREFVQAAEVFKPISGLMAARFTSSTAMPSLASDQPDQPAQTKVEDPAEEAAKSGMYGPMTRSHILFHPTRLLCKRFGIKPPTTSGPDPNDGLGESATDAGKSDLVSQESIDRMMLHAKFHTADSQKASRSEQQNLRGGFQPSTHAAVDPSHNEAVEGQRADEQVLKSIFES